VIDSKEVANNFPQGIITPSLDEMENALERRRYSVFAAHYDTLKDLYQTGTPQRDYLELLWVESQVAQGINAELCQIRLDDLYGKYPHLPRLWFAVFLLAILRNDFQKAATVLHRVERLCVSPRNQSSFLTNQARLSCLTMNNEKYLAQIVETLVQALRIDPVNFEALEILASLELAHSKQSEVVTFAEQFLEIQPLHLGARAALISVLRHRGELSQAQDHQEILDYLEPRVDRHEEIAP
jgi:hypothetical protein